MEDMDVAPTSDRHAAAFLGLALGDAYGRPLEFVRVPRVRTAPVDLVALRWTDDTHMSLYLAEAVLALPPGPLDEDRFGQAVGEAFSRWYDDPLTPSTAPGNTCLAGTERWRRTRDWRRSGVAGSDGCGAVMRIAPLPIALAGDDLARAARIQATLTHDSDGARDAAVAACLLVRRLFDGAALDAALVAWVADAIPAGLVADAMRAAVGQAAADDPWLDERAIPPGDGGWRSASALGLAVVAALRWQHDFATAIDRAARIDGDSDSVACLSGLLLGAAGGIEVLPAAWLSVLQERDRIALAARQLAAWRTA